MNRIVIKRDEEDYYVDEAFKVLRANLQFCGEDKKAIAVTSSLPGEGKSSVSLRLAISLAEIGKKVLYVDVDLRKSVLAKKIASTVPERGMSEYLSGQEKLQNVINSTNVENLHLIMPGSIPPNPTELLDKDKFTTMITAARAVYDYIIIDTPPLGSVIDSAIIARKCDGIIIVIESGAVSRRFVDDIKKQLDKSNCHILGAVLNKMNREQNGRYGKYYGRYGKYYGKYAEQYKGRH